MTIAKQLNIQTFPFIIKDDDGKVIYSEDSSGYWVKQEWDGGKMICYEASDGYWEKREYAEGNQIYYEDSDGNIRDNRILL